MFQVVQILDPSDKFRPEKKDESQFRDFLNKEAPHYARVLKTYTDMHTNQTYDFAKSKVYAHQND